MKVKQVIVMRKDLNMRKGKMCAQAGHAVLGAYTDTLIKKLNTNYIDKWVSSENAYAKICVGVNSEEELLNIAKQGEEQGYIVHVVTDAGFTEFHGEPTLTCLAFEPLPAEDIDKITGGLALL